MKVQHVRFCRQCEEMLSPVCERCKKHPERKPRVVELFDVPPVIATNECGCVKLRCVRPGCMRTMWRHPKADGTLPQRNHFCSPACVRLVTAQARKAARVSTPCSCGCKRIVDRPASNMRAKFSYFSQKCHYLHRTAMKAQARREDADPGTDYQTYICNSPRCHGDITDHTRLPGGAYDCVRCHARGTPPRISQFAV